MRDFRNAITVVVLALAIWTVMVRPSQAENGTVRLVFGTAGIVAGSGNGKGMLTFHGKTYPFQISGAKSWSHAGADGE